MDPEEAATQYRGQIPLLNIIVLDFERFNTMQVIDAKNNFVATLSYHLWLPTTPPMGASRPTSLNGYLLHPFTWFAQFAFANGDRCPGWQVRKGTGFVPISDLPSEDEEQDEEEEARV